MRRRTLLGSNSSRWKPTGRSTREATDDRLGRTFARQANRSSGGCSCARAAMALVIASPRKSSLRLQIPRSTARRRVHRRGAGGAPIMPDGSEHATQKGDPA